MEQDLSWGAAAAQVRSSQTSRARRSCIGRSAASGEGGAAGNCRFGRQLAIDLHPCHPVLLQYESVLLAAKYQW